MRIGNAPLVLAIVAVSLLLSIPLAVADVVELKNGQRVEGTLKQMSLRSVAIEVGGQIITFENSRVRAIYFGSAQGSASTGNVQLSPAREALRALKDLQSATDVGMTYRDFAPRVSEAKIRVDRYLQLPAQGDANVRVAIGLALDSYMAMASLWGNKISGPAGAARGEALMRAQDVFSSCKQPGIADKIVDFGVDPNLARPLLEGTAKALPTMLECASDRVNEAEKLFREP